MDILAAVLVITGATLMSVGALGLIRLPDVYNRTNAVAKATSLGLVCLLLGVLAWMPHIPTALTLLTAVALQLLTAPISGFAVGRAAHRSRAPLMPETGLDELNRDSGGQR